MCRFWPTYNLIIKMNIPVCPSCAKKVCPPSGHSPSILIVSDAPGNLEMMTGHPFATHTRFITAGKVFRTELQRMGMSLNEFRVMNLWLHETTKNENCFRAGYDLVLEESKNKKAILLVGADVVSTFTSYKVSEVSGLEVDSPYLSCKHIMAMVNPALSLSRGVGEVRFAVQQWKELLEKENFI